MNRPLAREVAMKRLVAYALGGEGDAAYILSMSQSEAEAEREEKARQTPETANESAALPPGKLSKKDIAFADALFDGVTIYREKLDEVIAKVSSGWSLERIDCVDLCLMRMAAYEIFFCENIPIAASIDEAVELAKRFGGDKSPAFINGILGTIARSCGGERPRLSFRDADATANEEPAATDDVILS